MSSNGVYACLDCRVANKGGYCGCGKPMVYMGKRWCAPTKNNAKAWKRIARGDVWWDKHKINKANSHANKWVNDWPEIDLHGFKMHVPRWGNAYKRYHKMQRLARLGR